MEVRPTPFADVLLLQSMVAIDHRGSFERLWSGPELEAYGAQSMLAQVSLVRNLRSGTVRGLHYSAPPHEEVKSLRVVRGAIFDVVVDIRTDSPNFGQYLAFELRAGDGQTLYIPRGYAHGYQTLEDDTEIVYHIDRPYVADSARGIRYNDPEIRIGWPLEVTCVAERDAQSATLASLRLTGAGV